MNINPLTAIDFYKADHRRQYPEGTTEVYSNMTPRSNKHAKTLYHDDEVVLFALQYFIKDFLIDTWSKGFFQRHKGAVLLEYSRRMDNALGKGAINVAHIGALHDLGYLPIEIKALPEGTRVPVGVPMLTMVNTHPDFFWLTNYLESVMSCYLWKGMTSATTAFEYKRLLMNYAHKTGSSLSAVDFQAHDFSFRGMSSYQDAMVSGAAHLTMFKGTDSVPAIDFLETYYRANSDEEVIGCSVPATEHSVMCMGQHGNEIDTFRRLINEVYPKGRVSIVSDTWDFWKVITKFLPILKKDILARDGTVVIRPDSGDPVKIICGDPFSSIMHEAKGAVWCLWDTFGGTRTSTGHKLLDSHIRLIYGDSITLERAEEILNRLETEGFASENVILGVGSYTYQMVTRDNHGFAVKSTSGVVNGERREIFKDPMTDDGTKKSLKGLLRVYEKEDGTLAVADQQTEFEERHGLLQRVFHNGTATRIWSLAEIRARLADQL